MASTPRAARNTRCAAGAEPRLAWQPAAFALWQAGRQAGRQAGGKAAYQPDEGLAWGCESRTWHAPTGDGAGRGRAQRAGRSGLLARFLRRSSSSDVIISSSRHAAPLRAAPAAAWRAGTGPPPSAQRVPPPPSGRPPEHSPGAGLVRRRAAPATRPVCRDCADAPAPARCARRAGEPSAHCRGRPYWRARRAVIGAGARAAACCAVRQAAGRLARSRAAAQAHAAAYQYLVRGGHMRRRNTRGTRTYNV